MKLFESKYYVVRDKCASDPTDLPVGVYFVTDTETAERMWMAEFGHLLHAHLYGEGARELRISEAYTRTFLEASVATFEEIARYKLKESAQ